MITAAGYRAVSEKVAPPIQAGDIGGVMVKPLASRTFEASTMISVIVDRSFIAILMRRSQSKLQVDAMNCDQWSHGGSHSHEE